MTFRKACSPYVIERSIDIYEQATLTIEAGTVVLFAESASVWVSDGRLDVQGTASDPVLLDAASANPAGNRWSAVRFSGIPKSPSRIQYATIRNCGWGEGCVWTNTSKGKLLEMDHVTISDPYREGFAAVGGSSSTEPSGFSLTNCTFRNIPKDGFAVMVHAQEFAGIGTGNDFGGSPVAINGGWIGIDTTWSSPGTDIVVLGTIDVSGSLKPVTLTIGAGARFFFMGLTGVFVGGYNRLEVQGTADKPVLFSYATASLYPGYWLGIDVSVMGDGPGGLIMSHAVVEHAGGISQRSGGIMLSETLHDAVITDSVIRHNVGRGIYLSCYARSMPVLTGTKFESNASDVDQTGNVVDNVGPGPRGTAECP
jgi:hypothetical protein